jgi:ribosomal protein L34
MSQTIVNQPIRIQRKRTKGFNLQAQSPDGRPVVSVCRPGKWGNEFRIIHDLVGYYIVNSKGVQYGAGWSSSKQATTERAVELFQSFLKDIIAERGLDLEELRGKHLACFCPLVDELGFRSPCHADVLLANANKPAGPPP